MHNSGYAEIANVRFAGATNVANDTTKSAVFALDTTFVLFFLALDLGRSWFTAGIDGVLAAVTLIAFAVLPYFLSGSGERPMQFGRWVAGRAALAGFGATLGVMLGQASGVLLPEWAAYLPMTMLIVSAIFSLYLQLYGIIKVRLAR